MPNIILFLANCALLQTDFENATFKSKQKCTLLPSVNPQHAHWVAKDTRSCTMVLNTHKPKVGKTGHGGKKKLHISPTNSPQ